MKKILQLLNKNKYAGDRSRHRTHTTKYEDLCQ